MPTRKLGVDQSSSPLINNDMVLGEMRGQLREVVHSLNNLSAKFDGLTREVIALGPLAADISEIKTRVAKLEECGNRQSGALATLATILQSPVLLGAIMLAGVIWALATGRFTP